MRMANYYNTIVVGSDGSKSSLLAVERAAKMAVAFDATLVIGTAYYQSEADASKALRQDSVTILGDDQALKNTHARLVPRTCRPQRARAPRLRR